MKRIYDHDWQRLRARHLARHPMCAVRGCKARARHVDHIVTVKAAPDRRLDPSNLQSLCHRHHSRLTAAYDVGSIRGACDGEGMPLDPGHPWAQLCNAEAIRAANAGPQQVSSALAARLKLETVRGRVR